MRRDVWVPNMPLTQPSTLPPGQGELWMAHARFKSRGTGHPRILLSASASNNPAGVTKVLPAWHITC
jgi:hypothetical protein